MVLQLVGLTWNVITISLAEIDWEVSANNCARMRNPLNTEKIDEYRASMAAGDVFPMPVVEVLGAGKYVILGGNQRCNALKQLSGCNAEVVVYCVKPLISAEREAVIRSLNARHGWGTEKSERLEHAVYLVRECGMLADDAARLMTVSATSIFHHIRAENARMELSRKGIDANKMPLGILDILSRFNDENLQTEVAKLVEKFGPTIEQTRMAAAAIEKERSPAGRHKALKEWSSEMSSLTPPKKSKTVSRPRREKFMKFLETFSTFLDRGNDGTGFSSMDELQCSDAKDGDKVRMLCKKIIARLQVIGGF
jgi:hypothetical protein